MTQSILAHVGAHACVLHGFVLIFLDAAGHALPPWAGEVKILRVNVCRPPPQDAEHAPEALKVLIKQSTGAGAGAGGGIGGGHAWVLQRTNLALRFEQ